MLKRDYWTTQLVGWHNEARQTEQSSRLSDSYGFSNFSETFLFKERCSRSPLKMEQLISRPTN